MTEPRSMTALGERSSPRRRPSTIVDVANTAGVAIGTVSRYLNGYSVRAGNRDQIEDAIAKLGYRRNALAAAMKTDLTNTIGFMVPSLSEFHSAILEYLSRSMRQSGRAVLSYCHDVDRGSIRDALDFFAAHRVDCLVMDGQDDIDDGIRKLVASGTPVIFYDNSVGGLPVDRVLVENTSASQRAVTHLLDIGHTRIAVLAGSNFGNTGRERLEGYLQALRGRNIAIEPDYIVNCEWNEARGYAGMLRLLSLSTPPTAVYSCNYNMTVGALALLKEHGLRVPDDISIVSFDDVPLFRLHDVGITAIAQPLQKIAETITSLMESRLAEHGRSQAPHTITLGCEIILRGSTRRVLTPEAIGKLGS